VSHGSEECRETNSGEQTLIHLFNPFQQILTQFRRVAQTELECRLLRMTHMSQPHLPTPDPEPVFPPHEPEPDVPEPEPVN
jgi:hypothetical protein